MKASMKASVEVTSMKAYITSAKAFITFMKAFMKAFVKVTPVEAFVEAPVEVTSVESSIASISSMEASMEVVKDSTEAFTSFHANASSAEDRVLLALTC